MFADSSGVLIAQTSQNEEGEDVVTIQKGVSERLKGRRVSFLFFILIILCFSEKSEIHDKEGDGRKKRKETDLSLKKGEKNGFFFQKFYLIPFLTLLISKKIETNAPILNV